MMLRGVGRMAVEEVMRGVVTSGSMVVAVAAGVKRQSPAPSLQRAWLCFEHVDGTFEYL
jgi:hypothetical protein